MYRWSPLITDGLKVSQLNRIKREIYQDNERKEIDEDEDDFR
jgi:hypothetical protein